MNVFDCRWEKKIGQQEVKIEKMKRDMHTKEELKTVALGTSKINYLDPRITVAWCKRNEVPIEKVRCSLLSLVKKKKENSKCYSHVCRYSPSLCWRSFHGQWTQNRTSDSSYLLGGKEKVSELEQAYGYEGIREQRKEVNKIKRAKEKTGLCFSFYTQKNSNCC